MKHTQTNTAPCRYPVWPNWDELSCFYWGPAGPWRRGSRGPERALCPGCPPCLEPRLRSCSKVPHPLQEMRFIQDHQPTAIRGHQGAQRSQGGQDSKRYSGQQGKGQRTGKDSIHIIQLTGKSHIPGVFQVRRRKGHRSHERMEFAFYVSGNRDCNKTTAVLCENDRNNQMW
ncbi:unnamed protein product [Pleuronectes platessa]|uniref:Uncharacterized protein n=1 Tax=Pleuronectes platessa TaxID=8262 RepID=A0A9N7TQ04_PLEPL|nr:unnamed protein product [Pleuronectes platessa]